MSQSSQFIRSQLIQILSNNEFHSGEELGKQFNLSRAAISNHIKVLSSLGLDIYSVTGRGYRLAQSLQLLDHKQILALLPELHKSPLEILNVIDSTNQYLKDKLNSLSNGHTCLAEAQTAGRGRHGRKWVSPYAASLYLSMHWSFAGGYSALSGLSLAIGVAIVNTLERCDIQGAQLKWPNDIYAQGKKLAGVLIEVEGQIGSGCQAIVGIGLNMTLPQNVEDISQPWIDIDSLSNQTTNRNVLAGVLIDELIKCLQRFEKEGFAAFIDKWRALDIYANQPIKLVTGQQAITGICRGVDGSGAILLETENGLQAHHGGEISVRPV
jgi:BirA family biotin operon repressor/biotin-[acetyl-CoA-carboxylase] ligase